MGAFYGSILVIGVPSRDVRDRCRATHRRAYVLELPKSRTLVIDEAIQGIDGMGEVETLVPTLTADEGALGVVAFNHDDDALILMLCASADLLDVFISNPDYFEGLDSPANGDASIWCDALETPSAKSSLQRLFKSRRFTFETERHTAIAELLGWPPSVVGTTFESLMDGETPDGVATENILRSFD